MPFRRRATRQRRSFRRRGTRTRASVETQRWESAIFSISDVLAADIGGAVNMIEIMKIAEHVSDPSATTVIDMAFGNMVRYIEIGGIVFNFHVALLTGAEQDVVSFAQVQKALVTANIDGTGAPTLWQPNNTQNPISVVVGSPTSTEDQDQPIRIHWRQSHLMPAGALNSQADPFMSYVYGLEKQDDTVSLRLRRRIDDHQGLYFVLSIADSGAPGSPTFTYWINGTLYYRVRV